MSGVFTEFHTDPLGQEIRVGSKVTWVGGKYAEVKVFEVVALTDQMVRVKVPVSWNQHATKLLNPYTLLVVDLILDAQNKD